MNYWRVIVRLSIEKDSGSKLRNLIAPCLANAGLSNTKTGVWEGAEVPSHSAALEVGNVLRMISKYKEIHEGKGVDLDHIWIYIDKSSRA